MALAIILRNTTKASVGALQQNIVKSSSVIVTRDFTPSLCQNRHLTANKSNLNLNVVQITPKKSLLLQQQIRLMSADHSKLWPVEKALSVGLLALVPAAIAFPNILFDNLAAVACVIHFHWGLEAVVVDYVRPILFGNVIPKIALAWLYLISATTLGALIYYNVSDIGIGKTIRRFWAIKK